MLRQTVNCIAHRLSLPIRCQSTLIEAEKSKWDLLVGVQIERLPILTKSLNKLEKEYQECLWQLEYENSYKSDFEVKHENDERNAELLKAGKTKIDLDAVQNLTAQDLADLWKEEASRFQAAARTTEADKKNDLQSTERKLEDSLTLLLEQQIGKDKLFLLPQGKISDGETLYQAAQRIVYELCGDKLQTHIYGNAPCGFYKYKYPVEVRGDTIGAKVFFYRATLKSGQVDEKLKKTFQWLDKAELFDKLKPHLAYTKSLHQFII